MSPKERLFSATDILPGIFFEKIVPTAYKTVWADEKVMSDPEHGIVHSMVLLGIFNLIRNPIEKRGVWKTNINKDQVAYDKETPVLNPVAINKAILFHDTQRVGQSPVDDDHGIKAACKLIKFSAGQEYDNDITTIATTIVANHNLPFEEILANPKLKQDFNLRVFMFCDLLAQVRYKNHNITTETLNKILPGVFSQDELSLLIENTSGWIDDINHPDLSISVEKAIKTGIKRGFFGDVPEINAFPAPSGRPDL